MACNPDRGERILEERYPERLYFLTGYLEDGGGILKGEVKILSNGFLTEQNKVG
jgi:hypothetical protein